MQVVWVVLKNLKPCNSYLKRRKQNNQSKKAKCNTAVCSTWKAGLYFLLGTRKVIVFSFTLIKSLLPNNSLVNTSYPMPKQDKIAHTLS